MAEIDQAHADVVASLPPLSKAALFLDFDGTLVGFSDTPMGVSVSDDLIALLDRLQAATQQSTVILSGRRLKDFDTLLAGLSIPRIGSHGAEWALRDVREAHPLAGSETVAGIVRAAEAFAHARDGVLAEPKPAGVAIHTRQVRERESEATAFARGLAAAHPGFELHKGKMVCEVRPDDVNKGAALERVMARSEFASRIPVMIGDDATDEPAMSVAQAMGGIGVKVGTGESCAKHRLNDPAEVQRCLMEWVSRGAD